ncbi:DUF7519 family protein [Natrinema soli]|uniref:Uncharacterized protein n=1 Tax=Natrinema soli TaxID=1930624 RepID=A0ABD5SUC9_9EURY|nr:hypothetical protein [Natrinema soli]
MSATNPTPPDGSPALLSSWLAVCLAGIAWSVTVPWSGHGLAIASVGWLLLGLALLVGDRLVLTIGGAGLVLGTFVAAGDGAGVLATLVGTTASVLAWDVGQHAISIGRQLGRAATTVRAELTHVLASVTTGTVIVVLAGAASVLVTGTQPLVAVTLLLLGGGLVAVVFGPRELLSIE